MHRVCVIGGSRYFGRNLILRLRDAGLDVTVINRGSSVPPPGVTQLTADRDDEAALTAALGDRTFDVVIDQVCSTPLQASIARRVFSGRTGRYVMTSTVEVYNPVDADRDVPPTTGPVDESAFDATRWPIRIDLPWHDAGFREDHYGEGKRQAEAVFAQDPAFPFVAVRCAHVLGGGAAEFTGRLAHYVSRIATGLEIAVHRDAQPATFINDHEIADFLFWAAAADFVGPVNACSHGELTASDLCTEIAARHPELPAAQIVEPQPGHDASPFSFTLHYAMDNSRATTHGFDFSHTNDWLPAVIAATPG